MKLSHVVTTTGYHKVRCVSSQPDFVRIYKDRVRLNTQMRGDGVATSVAPEWVGPLTEGDLIEAEGEALTLTVEPHDPHIRQETRQVTALNVTAAEGITIADKVS